MASSKKGKKNKGKTLPLSDFLQETPGAVPTLPIRKSSLNWADEVEDHDFYDSRPTKNVVLPTAPKASRDFDDISDNVPQNPPYMAYLSNLPYDIDENEISFFFKNMKIANMRIPKDDRPGENSKLKGYGYVEFEDRESLIQALVIPDTTIKNRRIRIEVATDSDNDKRRSSRMDMNRDRGIRSSEVTSGDWRSGPRAENQEPERRMFSRDKDRERDDNSSSGAWRDDRRTNKDTGFVSRSNRDYNRDTDFSRPIEREDRPSFISRRDSDKGGFLSRDVDRRYSSRDDEKRYFVREEEKSESRSRPKLVLAPRTKPIDDVPEKAQTSISIFGNAKPVDTSAKERQIEERLAKESERSPRESSKDRKDVLTKEKLYLDDKNEHVRHHLTGAEKTIDKDNEQPVDHNGVSDKGSLKGNGDYDKKDHSTKGNRSADIDKQKSDKGKREDKREKVEKEMPKLKTIDPPNFIASNKFATLVNEDISD